MAKWPDEKPLRLIQTNLRQIDIVRDPRQIVREVKDFGANAILFSVGGIVSFYPSELEFQTVVPGLSVDFVGEARAEARALDLKFFARLDLSKCHKHVYDSHPEWFFQKADGGPIIYNGVYSTCINGGYYREYSYVIMQEIIDRYDIDGFFFNMFGYQTHDYSGNYHGSCRCVNCQKRFRDMFGYDLPTPDGSSATADREFRDVTVEEMADSVLTFIRSAGKKIALLRPRNESNSAVDRELPQWQYSASDNVKSARGRHPSGKGGSISSNAAVYFLDIPYRAASVSPHLTALRLAQDLANGGGIDLYVLGTMAQEDGVALSAAEEIFHYFADHEETYSGLTSLSNICLIKGGDAEYRGIFRLLTENHFPFDVLDSSFLSDGGNEARTILCKYKAMVLPGIPRLTETQIAEIDRYVYKGGKLLATGDSFLAMFPDGVTECMLQCSGFMSAVMRRENMRSSYFRIHDGQRFGMFESTDVIFLDGSYGYATLKDGAVPLWTLVPPSAYGPPEKVFIDTEESTWPGVVLHTYGSGRSACFPWSIGGLYYRHGSPGHRQALLAVLLELLNGRRQITTNAHPLVEMNVFRRPDGSYLLNLVNCSGHQATAVFEPVPMHDIEVSVSLPREVTSAFSLRLGKELPLTFEKEHARLTLERLGLFDTIVMKGA